MLKRICLTNTSICERKRRTNSGKQSRPAEKRKAQPPAKASTSLKFLAGPPKEKGNVFPREEGRVRKKKRPKPRGKSTSSCPSEAAPPTPPSGRPEKKPTAARPTTKKTTANGRNTRWPRHRKNTDEGGKKERGGKERGRHPPSASRGDPLFSGASLTGLEGGGEGEDGGVSCGARKGTSTGGIRYSGGLCRRRKRGKTFAFELEGRT